jgi:hypothetical protein
MATANLVLRFFTELSGIAAVGYAGLQIDAPLPLQIAAGIAAAGALLLTWALVAAPKAENGLAQSQKDVIGGAILLVAATALAIGGQAQLAVAFAIVVIGNTALLFAFGADARERLAGIAR